MHIISDTASLYSVEEGKKIGVTIIPACTIIDQESYGDYVDITGEELLEKIKDGSVPTTSQPSVGEIMNAMEDKTEDILFLSIGDGLSGGYQTAVGAKNSMEKNDHIHIMDTRTLAGPENYLIRKAVKLSKEGLNVHDIKRELQKSIETSVSFVIPVDFEFLKRSGRLTALAAKIGGMIKIVPVMTQTEDMKRIKPFVIKRSRKKAVESIIEHLKGMGVNEDYIISISHAGALETAKEIMGQIKEQFVDTLFELFHLSPTLITHGGPGSVVIQAIKK